jgi:hypothetical protein
MGAAMAIVLIGLLGLVVMAARLLVFAGQGAVRLARGLAI